MAPAVAFVASPLWKRAASSNAGADFADAGPLDTIPAGRWKLVPVQIVRQDGWAKARQARSVWVLRDGAAGQHVTVLSPICPHLGCPIAWSADASQFRCPCHGGTFTPEGTRVAGPPPRNMDSLDFQVRDDHLWVRWQDFKISVPERVAVQV